MSHWCCLTGRSPITASTSLVVIDLFRLFTSPGSILVCHVCLEIYPFLLDFPIYWTIIF
jgi:hypothetical protein